MQGHGPALQGAAGWAPQRTGSTPAHIHAGGPAGRAGGQGEPEKGRLPGEEGQEAISTRGTRGNCVRY